MQRRALLGSIAGISPLGLAGCLDSFEDSTAKLSKVSISNTSDDRLTFHVRVHRDGELVHESAHELDGRDENLVEGTTADCTWEGERGEYVVAARIGDGEWNEREVTDGADDECVAVDIKHHEGEAPILTYDRCYPPERGGCIPEER